MGIKKEIKNFLWLVLGSLLIAVTFNSICVPNNYVTGGISGISIIFNYLFNINVSLTLLIGNLIVLFMGLIVLGFKDTYRSIIGSIVYTLCVYLTEGINLSVELSSVFLNVIVVGVLFGVGCTMVYLAGYTTGGTDILGLILNKKFGITLGKSLLIINAVILAVGTFVFGFEALVIALLIRYLESKIIDNFLIGISDSKVLFINTKEVMEVKKHIIEVIGSGISEIKITSGFKNKEGQILMCVVPTEKYMLLKNEVVKIDKDAFITVLDAYEVYGGTNRYKLPFHDLRI